MKQKVKKTVGVYERPAPSKTPKIIALIVAALLLAAAAFYVF